MPTEFFDGNTLRRISNLYKSKRGEVRKPADDTYRDNECAGLCIKVRARGATWALLTRDINAKIGDFGLFAEDDIPELRRLCAEAKDQAKRGIKPEALFTAFRESRDIKAAKEAQAVVLGEAKTWIEARDAFLIWARENKSIQTADGYRSALGAAKDSVYEPNFRHIAKKNVASITLGDLSRIKESIVERGKNGELRGRGLRQADLTVAAIRSCFRYMLDKPSIYGLEQNVALGLTNVQESDTANVRADSGLANRAMTQLEIGAFIYGLEACQNDIARLCLFFQLLTGQRRFGAVSSTRESFVEHEQYGIIWRIVSKGEAWRALPLGDMAQDVVRQAQKNFVAYGSTYLFPKARRRLKSDDLDGMVNKRTVSKIMETMREEGGVFHGSPIKPSTHHLRKALISYFRPRMHTFEVGGEKLRKEDIKMITHWNEGRDDTAALVYDKNDYLDVKHAILKAWEAYCMEGYTLYMQSIQPKLEAAE